ncbi:MAG TPA: ribosomal protein S18-alanine N-acetyltransferase [Bacillota bacterium]
MADEMAILPMRLNDLEDVMEVERASFSSPWSRQAFVRELTDNVYAHYIVARVSARVMGYAGMWLVMGEAHVTNIAIHPDFRGRGFGERLLRRLMEEAVTGHANRMTLEVRKTNQVARRLYDKLGFSAQGLRKRYYTDTNEDAIIMWNDDIRKTLGLGGEDEETGSADEQGTGGTDRAAREGGRGNR